MRPTGKVLVLLLSLALAAPATVLAQSAGDEQYVDPFQGQDGGGGGGGGGGNDTQTGSDDGSTTTTAQTAPTDTGDTAGSESDGATLPRTGLPLLPVVLTGLFLVGAGLMGRRLTASAHAPAAVAPALGSVTAPAVPQRTMTEAAPSPRTRVPVIGLGLVGLFVLSLLRRRA